MKPIVLQGGHLLTPVEERLTSVIILDGRIQLTKNKIDNLGAESEIIDLSGCYVTPGLIDLQVNGGGNCNLWADPTQEQFDQFCLELIQNGVTCFYPTLITDKLEHLKKNMQFLQLQLDKQSAQTIHIAGVHLEGPFISAQRSGVHPKEAIIPIAVSTLASMLTPSVKLMTLAPEQKGADAAVKFLKEKGVVASLGHSNATFAEAQTAFDQGVSMMTHTFNASPPLHHRAPGAVAAALLDDRVWCCFICDGLHLDANIVKLALRLKGVDMSVLVTDIASVGTAGGGLVGSSIYLCDAIRNVVQWQAASFREAIQMATLNPAKAMGIADEFGMIADGYSADLVVWDKATLQIKMVFVSGKKVYDAGSERLSK